jgi:hypothetical protein
MKKRFPHQAFVEGIFDELVLYIVYNFIGVKQSGCCRD